MLERMKIHCHQSPDRGLSLLNRYPCHQAASFSLPVDRGVLTRSETLESDSYQHGESKTAK